VFLFVRNLLVPLSCKTLQCHAWWRGTSCLSRLCGSLSVICKN